MLHAASGVSHAISTRVGKPFLHDHTDASRRRATTCSTRCGTIPAVSGNSCMPHCLKTCSNQKRSCLCSFNTSGAGSVPSHPNGCCLSRYYGKQSTIFGTIGMPAITRSDSYIGTPIAGWPRMTEPGRVRSSTSATCSVSLRDRCASSCWVLMSRGPLVPCGGLRIVLGSLPASVVATCSDTRLHLSGSSGRGLGLSGCSCIMPSAQRLSPNVVVAKSERTNATTGL